MRIKEKLINLTSRALYESLDQTTILHLGKRILPGYDIYDSLQISENLSLTKRDLARYMLEDLCSRQLFFEFIALMLKAAKDGLNGRVYQFPHLRQIVKEITEMGLLYDSEAGMFIEDPDVCRTKNWGTLRDDQYYLFTFLRLDVVGNTELVRDNGSARVKKVYKLLFEDIQDIVENHGGRIWRWDGDGGIAAFFYNKRDEQAVLSAVEILHRFFLFNHFMNPLDRPISLRQAVCAGHCRFSMDDEHIMHNESIKELLDLESKHTSPDSITVTDDVWQRLDVTVGGKFTRKDRKKGSPLFNYALRWKDA